MAHECPDCGQMCYCSGDIDDCCNNFEEDIINCTHCLGAADDTEDDLDLDEDDMRHSFQWQRGGSLHGELGYLISFDYDIDTIQRLKATIPSHAREWRPEEKRWWVAKDYEKALNTIFPGFLEAVIATQPLL